MTRIHVVLAALLLIAASGMAACAAPRSTPSAGAGPGPTREWYAGEATYALPDGRVVARAAVVASRRLDPAAGAIIEEVTSGSTRPGQPPQHYVVRMDVAGTRFEMREEGGAFTGSGELQGDPWRWHVWRSTSRLPDGSRVESADSLTSDSLRVRKRIYAPDGTLRIVTREMLAPVTATVYAERRAALMPK